MKKIAQIGFGIVFILVGLFIFIQALGTSKAQNGFVWLDVVKGLIAMILGVLVIFGAAIGGAIRRIF